MGSLRMAGLSVPQIAPVRGVDQLRPAAVELPMVALAEAGIAGPGAEGGVEAFMTEPHLVVDRHAPRHDAPAGLRAFLPIVHVVLFEGSGWAEAAYPGQPKCLLHFWRRGLVDEHPRPDLGLPRAARMPDAQRARGPPQQREVREHGAHDRVDQGRARPQPLIDLGPDLALVGLDLGHWRVAEAVGADAYQDMAVARRHHPVGGRRARRRPDAEPGRDRRTMAPVSVIGISAYIHGRTLP